MVSSVWYVAHIWSSRPNCTSKPPSTTCLSISCRCDWGNCQIIKISNARDLRQDYIRTARAKGLDEKIVIWRHALRAAMVSILPILGIQAGFVLSGAVYIEMVFQWPGVGRMLVDAILKRDILLVQGGVVFVAACYVIFNIAVDVAQHLLDPRIKI